MAVETKIGLLVGLAFIVCFGIILSHRGGGERITPEVAMDLLSRHGERSRPRRTTLPRKYSSRQTRDNLSQARSSHPKSQNGRPPVPVAITSQRAGSAAHDAAPERRVVLPTTHASDEVDRGGGAAPVPIDADQEPQSTKRETATSPPSFDRLFPNTDEHSPAGKPGDPSRNDAPAEDGPSTPSNQEQASPVRGSRPPRSAPMRHPQPLPAAPKPYVVRAGDTLWQIAERAYGVRSREVVDALFAANQARLASPDELRVGMTLMLPNVGMNAARKNETTRPSARPKTLTRRAGAPVRSYQVRAGDRYTTIAERLLGDKARWRELYDLNKDVFPEPDRIKPGVRIRIPATVIAQAGTHNR